MKRKQCLPITPPSQKRHKGSSLSAKKPKSSTGTLEKEWKLFPIDYIRTNFDRWGIAYSKDAKKPELLTLVSRNANLIQQWLEKGSEARRNHDQHLAEIVSAKMIKAKIKEKNKLFNEFGRILKKEKHIPFPSMMQSELENIIGNPLIIDFYASDNLHVKDRTYIGRIFPSSILKVFLHHRLNRGWTCEIEAPKVEGPKSPYCITGYSLERHDMEERVREAIQAGEFQRKVQMDMMLWVAKDVVKIILCYCR